MSGSGQLQGNTALGFPFSIFWKDSLGTETHLISSSISNPFSVFLSLLLSLLLSCHLCLLLCLIFKSCCSSCFILHSLFLTLSPLSLSNCIYRMETEICPCQKLPHSQTQPKLLFWALSIPVLLDSYFHLDRSKTHGTQPSFYCNISHLTPNHAHNCSCQKPGNHSARTPTSIPPS